MARRKPKVRWTSVEEGYFEAGDMVVVDDSQPQSDLGLDSSLAEVSDDPEVSGGPHRFFSG
jgi:hypothetical protein